MSDRIRFLGFKEPACLSLPDGAVGKVTGEALSASGKSVVYAEFPVRKDAGAIELYAGEYEMFLSVVTRA